jgi:glutamate carboxypeptidase
MLKGEKMSFNLENYLSDLETIVNIDSGSQDIEGVNRVAQFFKPKLSELGYQVKTHYEDSETGVSLEVTNQQAPYDIMLIGHMDTVFPKGTVDERPFKIDKKRAYGPGVIDMKSGLLLIYYLLKELKEEKNEQEPSICAILNGDEEIGSKNSKALIKEKAKDAKIALVLEPARKNGECVLERKGISGYNLKFKGRAAHAGVEPQKGASTVVELANWILELDKLNDYEAGFSVNVGTIEGGTAPNVIAEEAKAKIDVRFITDEQLNSIEDKLTELNDHPFVKGVKVEVFHRGIRPPMRPTDQTMRLWKKVEEIGQNLGIEMDWIATGGGSDANFTSGMGVSTIDGLGPAGGNPHSVDEYLDISSVKPRFKLLKEVIKLSKDF